MDLVFSLLACTLTGTLVCKYVLYSLMADSYRKKKKNVKVPQHNHSTTGGLHTLTVLIPAYNEAITIVDVVSALLGSHMSGLRIIVIDDGSTDETLTVLQQHYGFHPQVSIYSQRNAGKSAALNHGLALVQTAYTAIIDADTVVSPKVLAASLALFNDPCIAAICGNVKTGNAARNLLVRFQQIEYQCINYEKSVLQHRNLIAVIPGALGIFRTAVLHETEGFRETALTEDYDLTIRLIRNGYTVSYAPGAIGYTEVPETLPALYKQRMRWIYGNLQTVIEHKRFLVGSDYNTSSRMALLLDLFYNKFLQLPGMALDVYAAWLLMAGGPSAFWWPYIVLLLADSFFSIAAVYTNKSGVWAYLTVIPQRFFFPCLYHHYYY